LKVNGDDNKKNKRGFHSSNYKEIYKRTGQGNFTKMQRGGKYAGINSKVIGSKQGFVLNYKKQYAMILQYRN